MQRIMQILHDDHVNVARLLNLMEAVLEQVRTGNPSRLDVAYNTMRYMTAYPDLYHHPTEDIVFQRLILRAAETKSRVERLFAEHQIIGTAGSKLRDQLKKTIGQAGDSGPGLVESGLEYVALLREHMNVEEGEIFPLIRVVLSRDDWEHLDRTIATTGDPVFGPQLQKSYQDLARALTEGTSP